MLTTEIIHLYNRFRLMTYRALFGRIRERDGSLSATEAFAADVIYLLEEPTITQLAETLGISQPNATYKINNLVSKGYAVRTSSDADRRECRVSVGDRFFSYYNTDYPFIAESVEKLGQNYTPEELALLERMVEDMRKSME